MAKKKRNTPKVDFVKFNKDAFQPYVPKRVKMMDGGQMLGNTLSGVQAGMMFGPWGAAIGGALGLGSSLIQNQAENNNRYKEAIASNAQGPNPYGNLQFEMGGKRWTYEKGGFREFKGPSHAEGGIPYKGVEVEGGETEVQVDGSPYVLSNRIINPGTGNSVAKDSSRLHRALNGRTDTISENTLKISDKQLSNINESFKGIQKFMDSVSTKKMALGGPPDTNTYLPPPIFPDNNQDDLQVPTPLPFPNNTTSVVGSTNPSVDVVKNGLFSNMTTGDKVQLAATAIPAIANIGRGIFGKAERVAPNYNEYNQSMLNRAGRMNIDYQALLNEDNLATNALREAIRGGTTSSSVARSNLQQAYANQAERRADIKLKEQMAQNDLNKYRNTLDYQIGSANVVAEELARKETAANKSAKTNLITQGLGDLAEAGVRTGKGLNVGLFNERTFQALKSMYPNFTMGDYQEFIRSGMKWDEFVKFKNY